ncbi:hypothetical protein M0R72_10745 [Candidatus Pacearchaeota archaeon]|jgi:hypothetical protein|nr:hypothetical protein [Candidatus Pacearchaeota archaeon]
MPQSDLDFAARIADAKLPTVEQRLAGVQLKDITLHPLINAFPLQCERDGCKEPQAFLVREVKIENGR